jgi:hypothetical protein
VSVADSIGPGTVVARSEEPIAVEVDRTIVMMSLAQGMYFGLEGAGPRIWALLERPRSAAELAKALLDEFEVDATTCLRDTCEFLETLRQAQLIRVHDATAGSIRPPEQS